MPGIFPNIAAGGVVIRDGDGVCLDPPNVVNDYCPPAEFETSCQITMLPEDCTARILPSQINAIVSEMLCFAASLTPEGSWDCNGVCNLSQAFAAWWIANVPHGDGVTITENAPYSVLPQGVVSAICASEPAFQALVACLISDDANNLLAPGAGDGGLFVSVNTDGNIIVGNGTPGSPITIDIAALLAGICASNTFKNSLATCLISATANNAITVSANGLFVNSAAFVPVARTVNTQFSLTGGGALSANRTLNLVNDVAAPGNSQYYGTNGAGTRGWYALPAQTGLGIGQTWQDLTASRTHTTSYQNTTGKPIAVVIYGSMGGTSRIFQVSTDNVTWLDIMSGSNNTGFSWGGFVIPDGYYYRINGSVSSITKWSEVR